MSHSKTLVGRIVRVARSRTTLVAAAAVAALGYAGKADPAVTTVYSNVTNPSYTDASDTSVFYQTIGGTETVGAGQYTQLLADDITPITGYAGQTVTTDTVDVFNSDPSAVTFGIELRFYDTTGANGGPGAELYHSDTGAVTLAAGVSQQYQVLLTGGAFALPSGTFWAGIAFDDLGGTTGATASQLNDLALLYYSPPTVGTSQDMMYQSNDGGTFGTNNPDGAIYTSADLGGPVTNFAMAFTAASVPEPTTAGLIGLAAAGGLARRRRGLARR